MLAEEVRILAYLNAPYLNRCLKMQVFERLS